MNLEAITDAFIIEKNDKLLCKDKDGKIVYVDKVLTVMDGDDKEVIIKKRGNVYINCKMFNAGRSWIKEIIRIS